MDLNANFEGYQKAVLDNLVKVTKTAGHLSTQDLSFHRSSSEKVAKALDSQSKHLLELTSRLLKAASKDTNKAAPSLKNIENVEDNWPKVVDIIDDQFEKTDASLDEYTGVIKRMSPAVQDSPQPAAKPPVPSKKALAHFPKVFDKPQEHFNRKINNFETKPWKPLLTHKPHALNPLDQSVGDGSEGYKHPYALEIEQYQYPARVYEVSPPIPYQPTENTSATFVDTEDGMIQMLMELKRAKEIAVDLEHHDYRTYVGVVCLMQISTRDKDWIVDTLKPWREKLQILNEVFTDPKILKVFHGSSMDMIWLQRDLGLYVVGLFDTYYAADALNLAGKGLKFLLEHYIGFQAQKQYQMADWRTRPLPEEFIDYARSDTHYLLNIYDRLRNQLVENSTSDNKLVDHVLTGSKEEALQVYQRFDYDTESGRGSHGWYNLYTDVPRDFDKEQFAVFKALHAYRDQIARVQDESPGYFFNNRILFTLAEHKPTNQTELHFALRPVNWFISEKFGEMKGVIFAAKEQCKDDLPVWQQIRDNEAKHGIVRNRWKKSKEAPKAQHDGIGSTLNQLRLNGEITDARNRAHKPSPPPLVERAELSTFWGGAPPLATPQEVEYAISFFALNNVFPYQQMSMGEANSGNQQLAEPAPEAMEDVTPSTPISSLQPKNDIFTLKEQGRKRKASEAMQHSDSIILATGNATPNQSVNGDDQQRSDKKRRKEEKKAKKAALKAEQEQQAATYAPVDYAAQPDMLTTPQQVLPTNKPNGAGMPFNPSAKALDTSTGARQNKMGKELKGKSMTFK